MKKNKKLDELEAFEAWITKEAGPGAIEKWIEGYPAYANDRVQDYRTGWLACIEWMDERGKNRV